MRWLRLTFIALAALLLTAVASIAYLLSDPARLREPVARVISALIDRPLRIDGDFHIDYGRELRLLATDLHIANPAWLDQGDFLRVAEVRATIDLRTLLNGPLILPAVSLRDAELSLVEKESLGNNWTFGAAEQSPADDARAAGPAFLIRDIDVAGSRITLTLPTLARPLRLDIDRLTQRPDTDGLLDVALAGQLGGKPVRAGGELGPFANLLELADIRVDLAGQFDSLSLSLAGRIDSLTDPRRPELELAMQGPDVRDLAEMLSLGRVGDGGIDLAGEVRPTDTGVVAEIRGQLGRARIDVAARSAALLDSGDARITADVQAPNFGRVLAVFGINGLPEEPFSLAGSVERRGSILTIEDARLDVADARVSLSGRIERFPDLDGASLQLAVAGTDIARFREILRLPGVSAGPFTAEGTISISPAGNELLDVGLQTELFDLRLSGPIGDPPDYYGTRLRGAASGDNFGKLADALGLPGQREVSFQIAGELELTRRGLETRETAVLRLGDQRLELDGLLGTRPLAADTDARFRLYGDSTDALAELLGAEQFVADAAYDVSGRFRARSAGFRLDDVAGRIADARFSATGLISRDPQLVGSDLRFAASGPDLEQVLADTEAFDIPAGPFELSGAVERRRESIRLSGFKAAGGRASLTAEAELGWPPDARSSGEFAVSAQGPDLAAVLPEFEAYQPDAAPFSARATGSWASGTYDIEQFVAQLAGASVSASGRLDQAADISRTDVDLVLTIPDLSAIGSIRGRRLPPQALDLSAHVSDDARRFAVDELDARIGESPLTGAAVIDLSAAIPDIVLELRSPALDLKPFLARDDAAAAPEAAADPAPPDGRVIPDLPLPLDALGRVNARVDLDVRQLTLRNLVLRDLILVGSLRDSALELARFEARGPFDGTLSASASLIPAADGARAKLSAQASSMRLDLFGEKFEDLANVPVSDFSLDLHSRGDGLRQLAAGLNGSFRLESRGGRIPNEGLQFFTGDFLLEVLQTLNPFVRKEPFTGISCIALLLDAQDGVVRTAPAAVMQTDKLNIFVDGSADLRRETQSFTFRTSPRKGITISISELINPFFRVGGTFARPNLSVDPARATVSGTAAVLTAGLSILAKAAWDRAFRDEDPCAAAIERADKLIAE